MKWKISGMPWIQLEKLYNRAFIILIIIYLLIFLNLPFSLYTPLLQLVEKADKGEVSPVRALKIAVEGLQFCQLQIWDYHTVHYIQFVLIQIIFGCLKFLFGRLASKKSAKS
jgi:hypothetical protein